MSLHQGTVLSGGHAVHAAEVLDHMAAVGIAGLPADGLQVQVGIGQVLLHGFHTELFNTLLAADAEIVVEALGEPGVADGTAGGQVLDLEGLGDVLLNATNLILGESETRRWNAAPYVGAGINRNFTYDEYGMGLRLGLQNSWKLSDRWYVHLDVSYSIYEPDTDGVDPHKNVTPGKSRHTFGNRDRSFGVEAGITYAL